MPDSSLAGYLTRPDAAGFYSRSQRSLERDLNRALATRNQNILVHFKLLTKDSRVRPAEELTTKDINDLQEQGMIPVWYVEESWLESKYGKRGEVDSEKTPAGFETTNSSKTSAKTESNSRPTSDKEGTAYVDVLLERIRSLQTINEMVIEDKQRMQVEIETKNEQIKQYNLRMQETNKLMAGLQITVGDPSNKLLQVMPLNDADVPRSTHTNTAQTSPIRDATESEIAEPVSMTEQPTESTPTTERTAKRSQSKSAKKQTRKKSSTRSTKKSPEPTILQKHLPTFSKFFSRS